MAKEYIKGTGTGRGGWRGGGHPFSENPKRKLISFRVDTDIEDFIVNMKNRSKYLNGLIRQAKNKEGE